MQIILIYLLLELTGMLATCFLQLVRLVRGGKAWWKRDRLYVLPLMAIAGLVQMAGGALQKAKAAKLAKDNKRPPLEDNPYIEEAYDLTGSRAQQGLTSATMQAYNTATDRGLASSIDGILKSGGSSNNIAALYEGSQTGLRTLALANEEAKIKNIQSFLTQGIDKKADENRDQWFLNKQVPFKDMAALSSSMSEQGATNIWKGINTGLAATMAYSEDKAPRPQEKPMAGTPLSQSAGTPLATPYSQRVEGSAGSPGGSISEAYLRSHSGGPRFQFDARSNKWIPIY